MSKPLHTWRIAVTTPLSLFECHPEDTCFGMGLPSDSKVGSHPYITMGIFDYLSIEVLMRHAI